MHTFLTALMFFTRIPVPASLPYSPELLNKALRFFPLIGALVGALGAGVLWLALLIMPLPLALLLSMAACVFITGAFHEDGFADFCDGYGGGTNTERILEIMKDSRLGTYGVIGLLLILATKFTTLIHLPKIHIFNLLIVANTLSRLMPVFLVRTCPYIRHDALSKAKPIGNQVSSASLWIAILSVLPFLFLLPPLLTVLMIVAALLVSWRFRTYIIKRSGGYSGDGLGALQQLTETTLYLIAVIYFTQI